MLAVQVLNKAKENGQELALNAYDNTCSFMLIVGLLQNQGKDYWASLFEKLQEMCFDEFEVTRVIQYLIEQSEKLINSGVPLADLCETVCKLYFGQFHRKILKLDTQYSSTIKEWLGKCGQGIDVTHVLQQISQCSQMHQKNI